MLTANEFSKIPRAGDRSACSAGFTWVQSESTVIACTVTLSNVYLAFPFAFPTWRTPPLPAANSSRGETEKSVNAGCSVRQTLKLNRCIYMRAPCPGEAGGWLCPWWLSHSWVPKCPSWWLVILGSSLRGTWDVLKASIYTGDFGDLGRWFPGFKSSVLLLWAKTIEWWDLGAAAWWGWCRSPGLWKSGDGHHYVSSTGRKAVLMHSDPAGSGCLETHACSLKKVNGSHSFCRTP